MKSTRKQEAASIRRFPPVPVSAGNDHGSSGRTAYWLVGCSLLFLMMGTTTASPLYAVYQKEWGFSAGVLTLIFAGYVAALIPSLIIFGRLSDAFGRRRVALSGLSVAVAGSLIFALAQGVGWLFAARMVQGVAVGITAGPATAALAELEPGGNRKAAALVATAAMTVGSGVGPLFGSILAQYAPLPLVTPYLAYIALFVPAVVGLWATMPETVAAKTGEKGAWKPRRPEVPERVRRPFAVGAASCFLGWAVGGLFFALVPSYAASLLNAGNLVVGGGAVFAMFASASAAQLLLRKLPPGRAMTLGSAAVILGLVALVVAVPAQSVWWLVVGALLDGAGLGLSFMGGLGLVSGVAPSESRAEVISACYVITYLGLGLPTVLVGFASDAFGLFASVMSFAVVITVLSLFVALAASKTQEPRSDEREAQ